jgi:hypothetical protein
VHNARLAGGLPFPRRDDRKVVAEKPYPQPGPVMTPGQGGSYYGKEFLPLDGDLF